MATERRYSETEVQAILERALQRDQTRDLTHGELLAIAQEVGISAEALEAAASEMVDVREREHARERVIARRRHRFFSHLRAYVGVMVFLLLLNLATTPGYLWFIFPLLGWGLGVFFSAQSGLNKNVSEREIERELRRSELWQRRARQRPGPPPSLAQGRAEFSAAVEEGVGRVLSQLAQELRKGAAAPKPASPYPAGTAREPQTRISTQPPASPREYADPEQEPLRNLHAKRHGGA